MRLQHICAVMFLGATLVLLGCKSIDSKASVQNQNKAPDAETVYSDGARRITVVEADNLIKKGQVFVVDVRNQASYDAGHIPGSKLIPEGEIVGRVNELPRDKTILTYCS